MKNQEIKSYTLDEVKDKFLGKKGTPKRDGYELELSMDLLGDMIKKTRKRKGISQQELGNMLGVQKAWISKLENKMGNVSVETLVKVFSAMDARINFSISMNDGQTKVA